MASEELSAGQVLADKYKIEQVLGSGGMGVVLAALHMELDQRVAIKVLRRDLAASEAIAERFRREARAACKIKSPYGARVIDVGTTEDGLPYMVMEYLNGHDLAEELTRRGCLPFDEAASYVLQAADAICDAHDESIIHRDLKPANLFLTQRGGVNAVKVLDFGISKSLHDTSANTAKLTHTQALIGSPMYMSPEQLDSPRSVDERTDIWSLGIVLYELVAGSPPFTADGIAGLIKQIVADAPPALSDYGVDAPPEFEAVVLKCLAKDRNHRFASVRELMSHLAPFAKDAPLSVLSSTASSRETTEPFGNAEKTRVAGRPTTSARTVTEWGQVSTGQGPPAPRRTWPWVIGGLAAAAAAGGGFVLFIQHQDSAPAVAAPQLPSNNLTVVAAAPEEAAPEDTAREDTAREDTEATRENIEGHSASSAQPSGNASSTPEADEPSGTTIAADEAAPTNKPPTITPAPPVPAEVVKRPLPPARPPKPKPVAKPVPADDPPVAKPKPPGGISDFGGRH